MLHLRRWLSLRRARAAILLYHRVAEVTADPQLLCVSPRNFADHLAMLNEHFKVVRLGELPELLGRKGKTEKLYVAITFDDGYVDNLVNAKPLIAQAGACATVFAVAGWCGTGGDGFWWDRLEQLILRARRLPQRLECEIDGTRWRMESKDPAVASQEDDAWNVLQPVMAGSRYQVYRDLYNALRKCPPGFRIPALEAIARQIPEVPSLPPLQRPLAREEIPDLCSGDCMDIGAHSVTHPVLAVLPEAQQRDEIQRSRRSLADITGQPVTTFSYPYGGHDDFSVVTARIVEEEGFVCACANWEGLVSGKTDLFRLPRFIVRNWDAKTFARTLGAWLES